MAQQYDRYSCYPTETSKGSIITTAVQCQHKKHEKSMFRGTAIIGHTSYVILPYLSLSKQKGTVSGSSLS